MEKWLKGLLTLMSQFLNVLFLFGWPDETVSGRSYRRGILGGHPGWAKAVELIDKLFFWEKHHCRKSHLRDVDFAIMILSLRHKAEEDE